MHVNGLMVTGCSFIELFVNEWKFKSNDGSYMLMPPRYRHENIIDGGVVMWVMQPPISKEAFGNLRYAKHSLS